MITSDRLAGGNSGLSFPVSLFPGNKPISVKIGKQFSKFLATIESIFALGVEAIENFKQLELKLFDSLATDCACHIRALHIIYIAKSTMTDPNFQQDLDASLTALQAKRKQAKELCDSLGTMANAEKLKSFKEIVGLFSKNPTCSEVLEKLGFVTLISAKVHYLINAYLLTIVKDNKRITEADQVNCLINGTLLTQKDNIFKEVTNPKALSDYARKLVENKEITSSLFEKEVCVLARKNLLEASANFILQAAARSCSVLPGYFLEENKKMVQGKVELPDYYTLTAVFQNALYENIPVILIIDKYQYLGHVYREVGAKREIAILLVPSKDRTYFQPQKTNSANLDPKTPVIIVVAKATYVDTSTYLQKLMSNFNFLRLCQLDGAQHKQYTDSPMLQRPTSAIPSLKEEKFKKEAEKLRKLHEEAYQVGSSIHSPNANFILSHIFADRMGNYYNTGYPDFFDHAADYFSRDEDTLKGNDLLAQQFQAADTKKYVTPSSFVTKPLYQLDDFRPSSTKIDIPEEKMQRVKRITFSQPDLHHSLRTNDNKTPESEGGLTIGAPIPIGGLNQAFRILSNFNFLTDSQYSTTLSGGLSPIFSGMAWRPLALFIDLGSSPSSEDLSEQYGTGI